MIQEANLTDFKLPDNASSSLFSAAKINESPHFVLSRASGFSLLAEPAALSFIYCCHRKGDSPTADIQFTTPNLDELDDSGAGKLGILNSLFGLALLDTALTIRDRAGQDIQNPLFSSLWDLIIARRGVLGAGDYTVFVSRDPSMPIPEILRDPARAGDRRVFPYRDTFAAVLSTVADEMGIATDLGLGSAEQALMTFLYEIARNAHEHGRTQEGMRGIIVQKFRALSRDELERRAVFPLEMRPYLTRVWSPNTAKGVLIAITIVDTGPGIHRTLPSKPDESEWDRLCRALLPGESRKPTGLPGRGEGFSNVLQALRSCEALRAFLLVRSGDLLGYRDFTERDEPNDDNADPYSLSEWPQKTRGAIGSSLTLLWPILEHADQRPLPLIEDQ